MDGTLHPELDAADIIAAIMRELEEAVELIQRPIVAQASAAVRLVVPARDSEPCAIQDIA